MHEKSRGTLAAAGLSFGVNIAKKLATEKGMVRTQGGVGIELTAKRLGLVGKKIREGLGEDESGAEPECERTL